MSVKIALKIKTQKSTQKIWYFKKTNSQIFELRKEKMKKDGSTDLHPRNSLFNSFGNLKQSSTEIQGDDQVIKYENGSTYTGQTQNDKRNGKGIFQDPQGNIYEGDFKNDKIEGYGVYKTSEGTVYAGEWQNEVQEGQGKETWPDGSKYIGSYFKGLKQGKGEYVWEDGSKYIGEWVAGNIHGYVC